MLVDYTAEEAKKTKMTEGKMMRRIANKKGNSKTEIRGMFLNREEKQTDALRDVIIREEQKMQFNK